MKKIILFISLLLLSISCISDNDNPEYSGKLLKSKIYLNLPSDAPNYNAYYEYENGFIKTALGYTRLLGDYYYEGDKLISKYSNNKLFNYQYDQSGRLKKQIEVGTNNYIELFYYDSKVITHRYYEYGGINGVPLSAFEKRELLLDSMGRIIKMTDLDTEQSSINSDYEIYDYDNIGNIIKTTTKYTNDSNIIIRNYQYENIKNPYYYSCLKYYQITYYLEFFLGLQISDHYGLTPNLLKDSFSLSTYEINSDNYPIVEQNNGITVSYEYFE
jgi:hypothetical protein